MKQIMNIEELDDDDKQCWYYTIIYNDIVLIYKNFGLSL